MMMSESQITKSITDLYLEILERQPDADGLEHYVKALQNKEITIEEIRNLLLDTEEYAQLKLRRKKFVKYRNLIQRNHNILCLGTFSVDTLDGGGKYVINNLYRRFPAYFNSVFLSVVEEDKTKNNIAIRKNFQNIQVPQNLEQAQKLWDTEKETGQGLFDFIQINNWKYNVDYTNLVKEYIEKSDLIILEHPYLANLIAGLNSSLPIVYHAHNFEWELKKSILTASQLEQVKQVEQKACDISSQIWVSSEDEKKQFLSSYGVEPRKLRVLPHGIDLSTSKYVQRRIHEKIKSKLKQLNGKTTFVFTGSWHPPNLESLEYIISELAKLNENFIYFIIGNIKDYYLQKHPNEKIPKNVILFGKVTDEEKSGIYELSDYAINPMFSGAGTNLKLLEYMAVGLPVISTDFGTRGIKISNKTQICSKDDFSTKIQNLDTEYQNSKSVIENYEIIKNEYDYEEISAICCFFLNEILNPDLIKNKDFIVNVFEEMKNITPKNFSPIVETVSQEIENILK